MALSLGSRQFYNVSKLDLSVLVSMSELNPTMFTNLHTLKEIKLPPALEKIGYAAFSGCSGLRAITIPASVHCIDDYAFERCTKLAHVDMPAKLRRVGSGAFSFNFALARVDFRHCHELSHICFGAFESCRSMTAILFPLTSVHMIASTAFKDCFSLGPTVVLPGEIEYAGRMFTNCVSLRTVVANKVCCHGILDVVPMSDCIGAAIGMPVNTKLTAPPRTVALFPGHKANQHPARLLQFYWRSPSRHKELKFPSAPVTFVLLVFQRLQGTSSLPELPQEIIQQRILTFLNCVDLFKCRFSLTPRRAGSLTTPTTTAAAPRRPISTACARTTRKAKPQSDSTSEPGDQCSPKRSKRLRSTY